MGASKAQVRLADDEDVILVHGVGLCALLFVSIVAQARVRPYPQAFQNRLVLRLQVALLVIVALSMVSMLTPVTLEFVWSSLSFGCIAASTLYTMLALTHLHGGFDALLQSCCSLGRKKPSSPAQPAPVPLEGEVFDARYKPQACWVAPLTDPRTTGSSAVDGTDGLRRRVRKQYPGGSGGPTTPLPEDDTEASPRDLRDQWRDSYDVADGIEVVVEGVRRSERKPVQPPPPANKQEAHAERWWEQGDQQQAIPPPEASVGGSQFRSTWKPQACWAAPLPEPAAVDHALEQERLEREAREARRQLMQLMQNQQRMSQAQERKEQLENRFRERLGLDDDDDDDDDDEYLAWRADQEGGVRLPPSKAAKLGGRDREDRLDGWLESGTGASREGPGRMIQQKQLEAKWWNLEADKHSLATKLAGVDREDRLDGWLESGTGALREGPGRRVADKHSLIRQVEGGLATKLGGGDREDRLDGWLESGTGASREGPGRLARAKIHALATEAKQRMVEAEWLLIQSLNDDAADGRADVPKSSAGKGRPEKRRLIVQAIVHMPSKDASESASAVLSGDTTQLSAALGVTIISIDVLASSPEPPSSPPPSPPPPSPPSSPFPSPRQSPPLPSPPPSPPPPGAPGAGYFLTANITIAGDPSDFTDAVDLEFRTKLANLLGVNLGDIRLVRDVRWVRATTKRAFSQRLAELEADGNVDAGYIEDVKLSFAQKLAAIEAVVGDMEDGHATFREDGAVATKEGAGRRNERSGRPPMDPHERRAMQVDAQLAAEQKLLEAEWLMLESQKLARAEERAEMRAVGSAASRDGAGRRREGWASGDLRAFARSMQPKLDEADGGDGAPANDSDLAAMQKVLEAKWLLAEIQRLPTETTDSLDGDSELPAQQEVDEARQRLAELESKEHIEALKDAGLTIEQKVLEARQLLAELEEKERAEALKSKATKDRPARSSRDISVAFAPTQAAALKVIKQQVLDVRQRLARLTIEQKVLEARQLLAELEKKERAEALKSKATKGRPTRAIRGADGAGAAIEGAALFAIQQEVDEARQRLAELEQERAEALKSEATKGRPTRAIRDADGAGAAIEGAPLMAIKQEVDEARQRLAELVQERAEVPKSRAGKERPVRTLAARVHDAMVSIPAAELFLAEAAKLAGRDREDRLDGWLESGTGASREGPGRLKEARPAKLADRSLRMQIAAELRPVTPSLSSKLQATGSRKDEERAEMRAVGSAASKEGAGRRREGGASLSAIARSMQPKLLEARELLAQLEKDERAEAIKLEAQKARPSREPMTESAALKVLEARSAALKQRVLEARQRLAELEKAADAVDDGGTDVLVGVPPYALADSEAGIQMQRDALRLLLEAESMMPGCSGGLSSELRLTNFGLVDRESERKAFREEWAAVPSNATKDRPGRYMAAAAARVAGKMLTSAIKAILTSDLDDEETRNAQASSLVHGLSEGLTHASSIVLNLSGLADQRIMGPRGSRDEEERADRVGSQKERAGRLQRARPVSTPSTVGGGYLQQTFQATQARKRGKMIAGRLRSDETSSESGGNKRSLSEVQRAFAEKKKGSRKDLLSGAGVNAAAPRCFKSAQPPMLRKGLSFRGKRPDDDTLDELADREGEIIGAGRNRTKGSGKAWGPLRYTKQKIVARKLAQKIGAASLPPPAILRQPGFDKTASCKGRFFSMLEPKTQSDSIWHMAALHRISERASGHGRASGRVSLGDLPNQGSGRLWKAGSSKMLLKTSSGRSLLDLIDKDEWEAARNDTDKQEQLEGKTAEERKKTLVERAEKCYKLAMEAALEQTAALTFSELLELERSERPLQIVIEGFAGELLPAPRRTLLQRWGLRSVPMTVMLKMVHKDAPVKVELLTASTKNPLAKPFRLKTVVDAAKTARKEGMLEAEREAASVLSQLHKPSAIAVDEESILESRRFPAPRRPLMRELAPLSDGYAKGEARKEKAPSLRKGGGPTVIAPQELLLTTNGSGKSLATPEASTTDAQPSEAQKAEKAPETLRLIEGTGTSPERSKPLSADKAKRAENLAELNEKLKEKMQSRVEQSMARQEQVLDTRQRIQRSAKVMFAPARPPAPGTVGSGRMDRTAASDAASATPATPPASRAAFLQRLKRTPSGLHVNAAKAILPMLPLSTSDDSPATSRAPETSRDPTRKTAAADVIKKKRAAQALNVGSSKNVLAACNTSDRSTSSDESPATSRAPETSRDPTRMTAADVMKKKRAAQALNVGSSKNVLAACNTSERSTSSDESPATSRAPETSRLPETSRDKFKKASKSHGSSKNVLGTSGRNSPSVLSEPSARLSESSDAALSNDGDVLDA
jgi:hypothetical protein